MAAVINTGLLTKDARSEFLNRFVPSDGVALYNELATRLQSDNESEKYRWLGSVPRMRNWGTGRKAVGLGKEAYDVVNEKYEVTIEVDRDELADDQTGQIRIRIGELALAAATHKDFLLGQLLINGATAGFNSYDGVTFFNTAHSSGSSGNQSNDLTFNAVDTANVTTEEFKSSIKQAIKTMTAYKDDRGQPMIGMNRSGLVCVVPPALEFAALEAVNATIINNTSNVLVGVADVKQTPWLTSDTDWYLTKTDGIIRPFIFQDREPVEFTAIEKGSDEEFLREKYLYGVRARYAMTYGYWQYCVHTLFN